jgi:hypothetical protein
VLPQPIEEIDQADGRREESDAQPEENEVRHARLLYWCCLRKRRPSRKPVTNAAAPIKDKMTMETQSTGAFTPLRDRESSAGGVKTP